MPTAKKRSHSKKAGARRKSGGSARKKPAGTVPETAKKIVPVYRERSAPGPGPQCPKCGSDMRIGKTDNREPSRVRPFIDIVTRLYYCLARDQGCTYTKPVTTEERRKLSRPGDDEIPH